MVLLRPEPEGPPGLLGEQRIPQGHPHPELGQAIQPPLQPLAEQEPQRDVSYLGKLSPIPTKRQRQAAGGQLQDPGFLKRLDSQEQQLRPARGLRCPQRQPAQAACDPAPMKRCDPTASQQQTAISPERAGFVGAPPEEVAYERPVAPTAEADPGTETAIQDRAAGWERGAASFPEGMDGVAGAGKAAEAAKAERRKDRPAGGEVGNPRHPEELLRFPQGRFPEERLPRRGAAKPRSA